MIYLALFESFLITEFSVNTRGVQDWMKEIKVLTNIRDLKHRQLNGRRRRFPTKADWAKGFVFGGENEV